MGQLQVSEVHTGIGLLSAPLTTRSTKLPAGIEILSAAEHDVPLAIDVQANVVSAIPAGVAPMRNVTLMGPFCSEKTLSAVAVQAVGTHVSAEYAAALIPDSVALEFGLVTE
jgi:hypothetical protein